MARSRSLVNLRNDAYKRADVESMTDRHVPADVTRYINEGAAELRDLIMESRGRQFFRSATPWTITTLANTTNYALSTDFYALISVRRVGYGGVPLLPFQPQEEPGLRDPSNTATYPTHYELRGETIELLPIHAPGTSIVVDYVAAWADLVNDADLLNGFDGWEQYPVLYAAREMLLRDDEPELAAACDQDMAKLAARIRNLAQKRDNYRARHVTDVRGAGLVARMHGMRRW